MKYLMLLSVLIFTTNLNAATVALGNLTQNPSMHFGNTLGTGPFSDSYTFTTGGGDISSTIGNTSIGFDTTEVSFRDVDIVINSTNLNAPLSFLPTTGPNGQTWLSYNGQLQPGNYSIDVTGVVAGGSASTGVQSYSGVINQTSSPSPSAVPVPGAVWLFGSALLGMIGLSKKRHNNI